MSIEGYKSGAGNKAAEEFLKKKFRKIAHLPEKKMTMAEAVRILGKFSEIHWGEAPEIDNWGEMILRIADYDLKKAEKLYEQYQIITFGHNE